MSSSKPASRSGTTKKDGSSRSGSKALAVIKGKNSNNSKNQNARKACDCLLKCDTWKNSKSSQNSKVAAKKMGKAVGKDGKKGANDHREKVVIVSKRSSSVSVVKSCNLRKSVSVRKVSYSTSFVVSSDDESDSDDDDDDESDYEERSTSRKKTVVKRTTSRVKSNFTNKKSDRAAKKAKAIKLLCEKLSSNKKSNERELRPRFPYNMLQEWPAERAHRMASLNALAKVHVLYENESRTTGENLKDADESSLIDFLNEENSDEDSDLTDVKSNSEKKNEKSKSTENTKKKSKPIKRMKKRKVSDVEIIDTRLCKRMASLNAQAILAASYVPEPKPKKIINKKAEKQNSSCDMDLKVIMESKCDLEIIETGKKSKLTKTDSSSSSDLKANKIPPPEIHLSDSKNSDSTDIVGVMSPGPLHHSWRLDSDLAFGKSCQSEIPASNSNNLISSSASTKVGVTQYSEVTKVQINSRNDLEVKEENSPSRKIERILGNDDVAITQMYHYQSKNANESYCVQMKTTYKPGSRNLSPAIPISPPNSMHPHMGDPVLHGRPSYYGHNPMLPAPPYHMNPGVGPMHPVMGMDHRIPHQYGGSAFSMPHYRHPQPMQYPHGEYGYYQPAGPLIQPHHEQYTIHKPVPYHPQPHLHHPPQRPHQPQNHHRDSYGSLDSGRTHHKNTNIIQHHHTAPVHKPNSVIPLPSPISEASRSSPHSMSYKQPIERSIQEKNMNMKPIPYSLSPKPISPSALHSSYPSQNTYREYPKEKSLSSVGNYPKNYDSVSPSLCNSYDAPLPHDLPHHRNKPSHYLGYDSKDLNRHETHTISRHQSKMVSSVTYPGSSMDSPNNFNPTDVKEPSWNIKTNSDDSPDTPVNFLPYSMEPRKEVPAVNNLPEPARYPARPPSVIEISDDNSRDTKTYIQLEVPRNNYREKIVVIDVEKEDINKNSEVSEFSSQNDTHQAKTDIMLKEDIATNKDENDSILEVNTKVELTKANDESKESPDIMLIEVKKKKESAVVRRARLHGKQRTFRDAYNRPLVPLSKVKKTDASDSNVKKSTSDSNVKKSTSDSNVKKSTSDSNVKKSTSDSNVKKSTSDSNAKKSTAPDISIVLPLPPPKPVERKFVHGWSWEGKAFQKQVYVSNDESPCVRYCYPAIKHVEGDVICVRDCVLLRSGPRKTDLPFVAKITALWDNPVDGEMTMSLMWYYRPEHTETEKKLHHMEDEIFASKHKDTNSVACIEDKCYVLTYSEYCRYRKRCKMVDDYAIPNPSSIVPEIEVYSRTSRLPPINVSPDLVFFCQKVYDFRQKRLLKNPM